jgi:cyclophilin family peptidyl-prolyl cis-trans isomerase
MSETKLIQGEVHTKKGVMKFELYDDATPIAVENFKKLIKQRGSTN